MKKLLILALIATLSACGQSAEEADRDLSVEEAAAMVEEGEAVFLDVRTAGEVGEGYIDGARHIDFYAADFEAQLDKLDRDETYIVYCHSGGRSAQAAESMREMGFEEVYNLEEGFSDWQDKNMEITK